MNNKIEIKTNRYNNSTNKTVWYNLMLRMIITMSVNNLNMSFRVPSKHIKASTYD